MERQLILRNAMCPAQVSPSAFDAGEFGRQLDLGDREDKVVLADLAVMEWEKVRLQVLPEQFQLGFKGAAGGELIRRAIEAFLARVDDLAPDKPVGFNAALLLKLGDGDPDPSRNLVNAEVLATSLGGSNGRGGATVVYHDEVSRWWIELSPQPAEARHWVFDFNRHFAKAPEKGKVREEVIDWFADVEKSIVAQFETISQGAN